MRQQILDRPARILTQQQRGRELDGALAAAPRLEVGDPYRTVHGGAAYVGFGRF